ncbi:MAG: N-6 DNA methylase, partial [Candidatus Marinimicrobia bacterium]|nr:N-6 DNA methylase [Candidatus Neomarinimicrobiota bacterium]
MKEKSQKLHELTDQFKTNFIQYKNTNYDEANTRVDFIDKFFELLDWDVRNKLGFSEDYRDVVREDKVIIQGKPKAPDYSFRIGKERKFFVEAKKPSVNIKKDIAPAYQVRRYGYTAKVPLSILTDFEEFAVYDTRIKPNQNDKASVARIFYCTFDEYEKNFEFIYNTFAKNSILKGSFDRYVKANKNKRGTSEVDNEFLKLIENWRNNLAKNIALRNKDLSIYNLNTAVQKTIDRIIFLRIAEDRNMETYGTLQNLTKLENIYENLVKIFIKADKKYNSGLFQKSKWLNELQIDHKILKKIIQEIYYPKCPYELSIMPIETLGNIYEQFLGKIIRLTPSHQAKVEEKPEVKKAGGVYYTPQYIVEYIVKNTVGEKISNKSPDNINEIKILDPACGSGSFLVGTYQYLLDHRLKFYTEKKNIKTALKKGIIYQVDAETFRLSIAEKKSILLNNIFGVDIDKQAVEVTKLSLLLKLMENENSEYSDSLFKHSDLKILPNLSDNIKCGNSLIGSDFYDNTQIDMFNDAEIRKINVFDWEKEFADILGNGGFDCVIGNPPYISIENLDKNSKTYFFENFDSCKGRTDIYVAFIEKELNTLNKNGLLSFIIPYAFTNQVYGEILRKKIIENYTINEIVDTSDYYVFKTAKVKNIIITIKNGKSDTKTTIKKFASADNFISNSRVLFQTNQKSFLDLKNYRFETKPVEKLLSIKNKILENTLSLDKICFVAYGARLNHRTKKIGKSNYIHKQKQDGYKLFLEGKNIE